LIVSAVVIALLFGFKQQISGNIPEDKKGAKDNKPKRVSIEG
jgi:hypothetical protein